MAFAGIVVEVARSPNRLIYDEPDFAVMGWFLASAITREWNLTTVGAAVVGCALGALALFGYYNQ